MYDEKFEMEFDDEAPNKLVIGDVRLCPICGETIHISGKTTDGRLIGSCKDAFHKEQWDSQD